MDNLSVLRAPYIQNYVMIIMVEKNIFCSSCKKNESFNNDSNAWKDIRGLSWLFCETCQEDFTKESITNRFACA